MVRTMEGDKTLHSSGDLAIERPPLFSELNPALRGTKREHRPGRRLKASF
jgi:hypothetical protein